MRYNTTKWGEPSRAALTGARASGGERWAPGLAGRDGGPGREARPASRNQTKCWRRHRRRPRPVEEGAGGDGGGVRRSTREGERSWRKANGTGRACAAWARAQAAAGCGLLVARAARLGGGLQSPRRSVASVQNPVVCVGGKKSLGAGGAPAQVPPASRQRFLHVAQPVQVQVGVCGRRAGAGRARVRQGRRAIRAVRAAP